MMPGYLFRTDSIMNILEDRILTLIATPLLIVVGFWLAALLLSHYLLPVFIRSMGKAGFHIDAQMASDLTKPIHFFIILIGIYSALTYLPLSNAQGVFLTRLFRSAVIVTVAWVFTVVGSSRSLISQNFRSKLQLDSVLVTFFSRIIKFIIIALAIVLVAHEWNYDVNGFIAGLGLGGLAFALAAKDALANIFGGVVIIMEKPFSIGDWVQTPSVEGTVEEISFRSTRFRNFEQALVIVPNSTLANEPITNCSRMGKRRVRFNLKIDYTGPRNKIEHCIHEIESMLKSHPGLHPDNILVRLENIDVNSLDVLVYYFTNTTNWNEYLSVKEDINFRIMDILSQEDISLALPGRVIYAPPRDIK